MMVLLDLQRNKLFSILSQFSILLLFFSSAAAQYLRPERREGSLRVGSVFLEKEQDVHEAFRVGIDSLKSRNLLNQTTIGFDIQYATPNDYFHLYTRACVEVGYGIISLFGPSDPELDRQLESISTALGIPLISSAPRPTIEGVSSATTTDLTLALHPTQTQLIALIKDLAKELAWKDISIIHDPKYGIIEPSVLAEALQMLGTVSVHRASTDLRATLVQLRLKGARNIIIDTNVGNVQTVIQATLDTGMMTKSYNYIFTMLDMKSGNWSRLSYSEALVFGFSIIDEKRFRDFQERYGPTLTGQTTLEPTSRVALTLDAVELLARGLEAFDETETELSTPAATSCSVDRKWDIGEELRDAFTTVAFDGMTGPISFSNGIRSRVSVEILKLGYDANDENSLTMSFTPSFITVGNWNQGISWEEDGLQMGDKAMLTNDKPAINKTLIITTTEGSSCITRSEPGREEGYCADLAFHLSKILGFHYKFKLVADGRYGKPDALTGQWDGMIGELIRGEADMALADLTVTASRQTVVDFSVPFMHTSLGILYKNMDVSMHGLSTLVSPFSIWVWVSIILAFFITSICLRLVAWLSPYQKDDIILPGSDHDPSLGQDLSWVNSMWLLASTLVLRGCDVRLQAASSRTIAVCWWLFSLVVLIIYASLISHWFDPGYSLANSHLTIESLLKNPSLEFGVVQSGSTSVYLQNSNRENLQKVWWRVQKAGETRGFQLSVQNGIDEVKASNGKYAFIGEGMHLKQALVDDCSLGIVGAVDSNEFRRTFAAAFPQGSHLRDKISSAILRLSENGVLHQLESKWWAEPSCGESGGKPQVKLVNFIGPLTILILGILVAIFIALGERIFHHRSSHRGFFRTSTEAGNGKIAMNGCDTESNHD